MRARSFPALALKDCVCTLTFAGEGLSLSPTLSSASGHLKAGVTFPQAGAYTLTLRGQWNERPFMLRWTVRAYGH